MLNESAVCRQPPGAVVTESQTFKKRSDFQSNDDYAVYVRENIQVRDAPFPLMEERRESVPQHQIIDCDVTDPRLCRWA